MVVWVGMRYIHPAQASVAGGRTGPEFMRVRKLSLTLSRCRTQEPATASHLGNTIELALLI